MLLYGKFGRSLGVVARKEGMLVLQQLLLVGTQKGVTELLCRYAIGQWLYVGFVGFLRRGSIATNCGCC